jgi:hypothetical protein
MEMAMANKDFEVEGDDGVGYCNPPRSGRFQKGQSGNRVGRPKGSKNKVTTSGERLRSLMLREAYRPITLNLDGREITVPVAQAVLRSLAEAAAKGEPRAQAMFFRLVNASEIEEAAYQQALAEELERQSEDGRSGPRDIEIRIVNPADVNKKK